MHDTRLRREVSGYLKGLTERGLTTRYIAQYRATLKAFVLFAETEEVCCTSRVTAGLVIRFCDTYTSYSASYQQKHWVILRAYLSELDNLCLAKVRPRIYGSERTRVRWLTPEEVRALVATPMAPMEAMLVFGPLGQGLRRVEVLRMTRRDAEDALRTGWLRVHGKGYRERSLPMQVEFTAVLRAYLRVMEDQDPRSPILGIQRTASEEMLKRITLRAGVKATFHDMRRTFARSLYLRGETVPAIGRLLGHRQLDTTMKYIGVGQNEMQEVMSRYRIVENCPSSR